MNQKELLNKIKWQIYMRTSNGGIVKKIEEQKTFDDDYLSKAFNGKYLNYSYLKMFLKGYYSIKNKDIYEFYSCLLKSDKVNLKCFKNNFYVLEFKIDKEIVSVPYPPLNNPNELASLRFELLDLILPYMISDVYNFKNVSFNEGPYEYIGKYIDVRLAEGDTVLDLFMGTGTTGVACKKHNRNFIGIELNKDYCEIAQNRIENIE